MKGKILTLMVVIAALLPQILVILGYISGFAILGILSLYGFVVATHLIAQIYFANKELNKKESGKIYNPTISIIIPVFNEDIKIFKKCLQSIANVIYPNKIEVIVIDDGSNNEDAKKIFNKFSNTSIEKEIKWIFHKLPNNDGKRAALYAGFELSTGDVIVTIDSDTIIAPDSLQHLINPLKDKKIGTVTGNISVYNSKKNLLTFLADLRYWLAFNQERAAQSYFGVMTCVCGVMGAYRKEVINEIKDKFISQNFLGRKCTFGDDRHLTNLVLEKGYKSKYVKEAKAKTVAPHSFRKWIKQQIRWNKSFYREYIYNTRSFSKHSSWLAYDLTFQAMMPFYLFLNAGIIFYKSISISVNFAIFYILVILIIGLTRSLFAIKKTKRWEFILFPIYSFIYMFALLPLKLVAIATIWKTEWSTR